MYVSQDGFLFVFLQIYLFFYLFKENNYLYTWNMEYQQLNQSGRREALGNGMSTENLLRGVGSELNRTAEQMK